MMSEEIQIPKPIADFIQAINHSNSDALLATFTNDALVNDVQREFWGKPAIKQWSDREIIAVRVTAEVVKAVNHYGEPIISAKVDGDFDKTNLPTPLILDFYFTLRENKIVRLIILHNKPAQ
jgi:hypothetical protein